MTPDRMKLVHEDDKVRLEGMRKDVAERLRTACAHLPDDDFNILVEKIALVQLRGEISLR
jgi:hypothetical protein